MVFSRFQFRLGIGILATVTSLMLGNAAKTAVMDISAPELLTFEELTALAQEYKLPEALQTRMDTVLATPFIYRNPEAVSPKLNDEGIRIGEWNIERGLKLEQVQNVLDPEFKPLNAAMAGKSREWEEKVALAASSVFLLSEVDYGMKRTGYTNIPEVLATNLKMHAVYGIEFLELSPLNKKFQKFVSGTKDPEHYTGLGESLNVDPQQYKGMHGELVLSKYPVLDAKVIRLPECYDWFNGEQKFLSSLEQTRRSASDKVFRQKVLTEIRRGGRMGLAVDLQVPEIPEGRLTVLSVHIEDRTRPECRRKQLKALLEGVKSYKNPVVIGGDFNTSEVDTSPTSIPRATIRRINNRSFYGKRVLTLLTPFTFPMAVGLDAVNHLKKLYDPTASNIPILLPNLEREFYNILKEFRFEDGKTFDLRGDKEHVYSGQTGFFGNSNQRQTKGFVPTFSFKRSLLGGLIGKYKLDWFIVKSYTTQIDDKNQPYDFAPVQGRTLVWANRLFGTELSDHEPLLVTLMAPGATIKKPVKQVDAVIRSTTTEARIETETETKIDAQARWDLERAKRLAPAPATLTSPVSPEARPLDEAQPLEAPATTEPIETAPDAPAPSIAP